MFVAALYAIAVLFAELRTMPVPVLPQPPEVVAPVLFVYVHFDESGAEKFTFGLGLKSEESALVIVAVVVELSAIRCAQ